MRTKMGLRPSLVLGSKLQTRTRKEKKTICRTKIPTPPICRNKSLSRP